MTSTQRADILEQLKTDILRLEGFTAARDVRQVGLGPFGDAFPGGTFPLGAVHEFLSAQAEDGAATSGFIAGLLSTIMCGHGATLWVSSSRTLFPPALKNFGLQPDRFICVDLQREKDVLWVMEEALKCGALAAVVGELRDLDFTASRRLQLAVEKSRVTGFIIRSHYKSITATACVSRWKITPMPSVRATSLDPGDDLPGIGFPQWRAELLRMRNGKPGVWDIQWINGGFQSVKDSPTLVEYPTGYAKEKRKAG